ncbi:unnamed protein product [Linum trigynum]|uniref:Uncharacterized protein n=1 Tax=Linum trigynum TaxID=586398 RepID=A0AAV2GQ02_9ROSI
MLVHTFDALANGKPTLPFVKLMTDHAECTLVREVSRKSSSGRDTTGPLCTEKRETTSNLVSSAKLLPKYHMLHPGPCKEISVHGHLPNG